MYNLPLEVAIGTARVYIPDTAAQLIKIFTDGSPKVMKLLGAKKPPRLSSKIQFQALELGIPGRIAVDEAEENLYIQSFLPDTQKKKKKNRPIEKRRSLQQSALVQTTSMILHLNRHHKLQGKLGQRGYNTAPFSLILGLYPDTGGRFSVAHKTKKDAELLVFRHGSFVRRFSKPKLPWAQNMKDKMAILEDIIPVAGKSFVIGSVALRNKKNFAFIERIIYMQTNTDEAARILLRNDNPQDFLAWAKPDGNFYMTHLEEDEGELLFKIFTREGEYIDNQLINFVAFPSSWRSTFLNLKGRIFSTRIKQKQFIIYEWK